MSQVGSAYAYLYDPVLKQSAFRGFLERLESRLSDFGLSGKIYRLSPLLHLNEIITDEQRRGSRTLVAVGTDRLFHQLLNAPSIHQFVVGFIPLSDKSALADLLGIPAELGAATILSHRMVKPVHLASANAVRFFWEMSLEIGDRGTSLQCDGRYTVAFTRGVGRITVRNVVPMAAASTNLFRIAIDLQRDLFSHSRTVLHAERLLFNGVKKEIRIDGQPLTVEKVRIEKLPITVRVIVGKHRHEALDDVGAVAGVTGEFATA